jgi:uncharacterized membrane protein YfcA
VEDRYVEPTAAQRVRALSEIAAYLLGSALVAWMIRHADPRQTAIVTFLFLAAIASDMTRRTRQIQVAREWPTPNESVLYRTRIRSSPWYVRIAVAAGYISAALCLLFAFLALYAWYHLEPST